jgi:hypothetical protein
MIGDASHCLSQDFASSPFVCCCSHWRLALGICWAYRPSAVSLPHQLVMPLVIADITRGTGRYNLEQGAAGTASAVGASLSTVISGYVAQLFGYELGFIELAAIGVFGLMFLCWFLPETKSPSRVGRRIDQPDYKIRRLDSE